MTMQNEKFEELISRRLNADLEPQRGKALAAFRVAIAAEAAAPAPIPIARGKSDRSMLLWAGVPSLLAACVAVVVTLHFTKVPTVQPAPQAVAPGSLVAKTAPTAPEIKTGNTGTLVFDTPVDQLVVTQNIPGGVILSDGTPLRVVRQQEIRQTRWVDPVDRSTMTLTEPTEKVGYVQVRPD